MIITFSYKRHHISRNKLKVWYWCDWASPNNINLIIKFDVCEIVIVPPPFASRQLLFANTSTVIGACQVLRKLSPLLVFNFFGTSVNGYIYMNIRLILISLIDLQVSSNLSNTEQ